MEGATSHVKGEVCGERRRRMIMEKFYSLISWEGPLNPEGVRGEGGLMPFSSKTSLTDSSSSHTLHPSRLLPILKGTQSRNVPGLLLFLVPLLVLLQIEVGGWREIRSKHNLDMIHRKVKKTV